MSKKKKVDSTKKSADMDDLKGLQKIVKDKKEERKNFKVWVEKKFNQIIKVLLIDFISVGFHYSEGDEGPHNINGDAVFMINANEQYHQVNIRICPTAFTLWREKRYDILIDGMVHELSHIHTTKLMNLSQERYVSKREVLDANEAVTETMAEYARRWIKATDKEIYNN